MKSDSPSCLRRPRATCSIVGPLGKTIAYILGLALLYNYSLIQEKFQKKNLVLFIRKIL